MKNRIPKYKVSRIFILAIILYVLMVMPIAMFFVLKMSPQIIENRGEQFIQIDRTDDKSTITDSLDIQEKKHEFLEINSKQNEETGKENVNIEPNPFNRTILLLIRFVVLFSVLMGLLSNLPFKIRFRKERKRKKIPQWINNYTRKTLLHTPLINAGILFLSFSIMHFYMIDAILQNKGFTDEIEKELFEYYLYISLVASLLVILFVYFWQKHLVHIRYIEYIFKPIELRRRIFGYRRGFIKNRLWISSAMTTLLPLLIVAVYLLISITPVSSLEFIGDQQKQVLLGEYYKMIKMVSGDGDLNISSLYYVNAFNNLLMFFGIISGIIISRNDGFIDKYIGDSIMALFSENVEDALNAAIEMRAMLAKFNQDRKLEQKEPIDSGIGIHTGNLMLGVVGGKGRMMARLYQML